MLAYLRSAGIGSLLLALAGMILGSPDYFRLFAALMYAAIVIGGVDLIFEESIRRHGSLAQGFAVLCVLTVATWFTVSFVWINSPLGLIARDGHSDARPGTQIAGIVWSAKYGDLRITISNETDRDYTELDLTLRPDVPIAAIAELNGLSNVSFAAAVPLLFSELSDISPSGEIKPIPLTLLATDFGYRMRCPTLPSRSHIEVVAAIASPSMKSEPTALEGNFGLRTGFVIKLPASNGKSVWFRLQNDRLTDDFWLPRRMPTAIKVEGTYIAANRRIWVSQDLTVSDLAANTLLTKHPSVSQSLQKKPITNLDSLFSGVLEAYAGGVFLWYFLFVILDWKWRPTFGRGKVNQ
jgi:hypothetical protein